MNSFFKKIFVFASAIFCFFTNMSAQKPLSDEKLDSLIDDLFFQEQAFIDDILAHANNYNLLYTGITFNSNTYYYGREGDINQFNIVPFLSYYNSKGFNASISGVYYGESSPAWDFTNISVGYGNYFGKKQTIYSGISFDKYIYTDGWDYLTNSVDAIFGVQNQKRTFGTRLCGSLLFGNGYSFQMMSKTDYRLTLIKKHNFAFKLKPQISFILSNRTIITDTYEETYFGFIYSQLNIPVNFITKNFDAEIGYDINFPVAHETETDLKPTGFFRVSLGYILNFTK